MNMLMSKSRPGRQVDPVYKSKQRSYYSALLPIAEQELSRARQEVTAAAGGVESKLVGINRVERLELAASGVRRAVERDKFIFSDGEKSGLRLVEQVIENRAQASQQKRLQQQEGVASANARNISAPLAVEMLHGDRISNSDWSQQRKKDYTEALTNKVAGEMAKGVFRSELRDPDTWNRFYSELENRVELAEQFA